MSGYRNYSSWNSSSGSSYSGSAKKETSGGIPKYDTTFGKSRTDATKKSEDDKSVSSRIASKYGGGYTSSFQREPSSGYLGRTDTSRIKPLLDKKDTSHPPVTYRPITRTGSRSRDPSPIEKSEKSSSSSSNYNYNRLYPKSYQSTSGRDRSISPSTTAPKYTSRTSEVPRYGGRLSSGSKDDIPSYTGRSSISKDEPLSSRYKGTSREDLSNTSQKYINSRFLPKNSVEKSYTAYTRTSTARANETSRKNRELLNVLHAQHEQERLSRPNSRCSSVAPEENSPKEQVSKKQKTPPKEVEMETITVVTRGTSPTPTTQHNTFLRSRRIDIAKLIQKQITRPKNRTHTMVDKEIQSDRLDDATKISRFAGASRITATPWSSFLDMKFSSPNSKQSTNKSEGSNSEEKPKEPSESPKNLSRANSIKSLSKGDNSKETKKSSKSKLVSPKPVTDKKQLPPQIPKNESSKSNSLHSIPTLNKDFRKSVLNMSPDKKKKIGRRSNSASSAESDGNDPDATDVSENLASCKSYHSNSPSKLPQKTPSDKSLLRSRRSPSSEVSVASTTTSGSEDDVKTKKDKSGGSRTSAFVSADDFPSDKSPRPPQSPRVKGEGIKSEAEAKSFIMRALAPVTNLFKAKQNDSPEKINWPESNSENGEGKKNVSPHSHVMEPIQAKIIIHRVESGDQAWLENANVDNEKSEEVQETSNKKPVLFRIGSEEKSWWMDSEKSENSPQNQLSGSPKIIIQTEDHLPKNIVISRTDSGDKVWKEQNSSHSLKSPKKELLRKPFIRHVESGELPWWLDETAEVPEGVETYPNWVREDGTTADGRVIYKVRKNDSDESSWWLSSSEKTDSHKKNAANVMDEKYLEEHKIRHIDSGERAWWQNSSENINDAVKTSNERPGKFPLHHQQSEESGWWLNENNEDQFDCDQIPLGDRASPEGLEMPKDSEGRQSPYDNVPNQQRKIIRPSQLPLFISKHTNIDEILGGSTQMWSPYMDKLYGYETDERCEEIDAAQVIIHEATHPAGYVQKMRRGNIGMFPKVFSPQGKSQLEIISNWKTCW